MALNNISGNVLNIEEEDTNDLKKYRNALEDNLKEIDKRIEQRVERLSGTATFSNDSTVNEAALLEEDKFWKLEILKKLQESSDELVARGLVEKMKIDIVKQSTTSSPARRDADYALSVYEAERAFELATRKHLDKDEDSIKLAMKLKMEEDNTENSIRSRKK